MKEKNSRRSSSFNLKFSLVFSIFLIFSLSLISIASAAPNVVEASKQLTTTADGRITVDILVQNTGDQTAPDFLVEIGPHYGPCTLSMLATVSPQSACDPRYPNNVHRFIYDLAPGESAQVILTTTPMNDGTYCVIGVSADSCCPTNPNCQAVQPYGWSTILGQVIVSTGQPDVCGDGQCTGAENPGNCPQDCGAGYCGDSYCNPQTETYQTCPGDCSPQPWWILWIIDNWWVLVLLGAIIIGGILVARGGKK